MYFGHYTLIKAVLCKLIKKIEQKNDWWIQKLSILFVKEFVSRSIDHHDELIDKKWQVSMIFNVTSVIVAHHVLILVTFLHVHKEEKIQNGYQQIWIYRPASQKSWWVNLKKMVSQEDVSCFCTGIGLYINQKDWRAHGQKMVSFSDIQCNISDCHTSCFNTCYFPACSQKGINTKWIPADLDL